MTQSIELVDAFANGPFTGNPAAVAILDEDRPEPWMQQVAMEMNQAETAFLRRTEDGFRLRWFTPTREVDLCGHATLASAHVLWRNGHLQATDVARFHTRSGLLTAERDASGAITLDFPAIRSTPVEPPPDIAEALGSAPQATLLGTTDLTCVFARADQVRNMTPDLNRISRWKPRGVLVTAPGDVAGIDYVARCFFPAFGVPEDHVTGSAHCALAVYWSDRLGKNQLTAFQASPRTGTIACVVAGDRVRMTGRAVTTMTAVLTV